MREENHTLPSVPRSPAQRPQQAPNLARLDALAKEQGERLQQARNAKGWSLRDLEVASGVAKNAINDIEHGKKHRVSCYTVAALADALEVKRGWLAFGSEIQEP